MAAVSSVGRSAEVLLGASMIGEEEIGVLLEVLLVDSVCEKGDGKRTLRTGIKSVDDALDGGLKSGNLVGIWSEGGSGGPDVSLHFLNCRFWMGTSKDTWTVC